MFCNTTGILYFFLFFFNGDNDTKILFSEYSNEDLKHVVNLLCKCLYQIEFTKTGQKLAAVKKKYSESKVFIIRVSTHLSEKIYCQFKRKFSSKLLNFGPGIFLRLMEKPIYGFSILDITLLFLDLQHFHLR